VLKIFYVTDIHGSEICWKKFLNAGPHYGADVVIVGGEKQTCQAALLRAQPLRLLASIAEHM